VGREYSRRFLFRIIFSCLGKRREATNLFSITELVEVQTVFIPDINLFLYNGSRSGK
jgi:hypothetical protein